LQFVAPRIAGLRRAIAGRLQRAERGRAADEIHEVARHVRYRYGSDLSDPAVAREVEDRVGEAFTAGLGLLGSGDEWLDAETGVRLRNDLEAMAVVVAELRLRRADPDDRSARAEAARWLDEVIRKLGPGPILSHERAIVTDDPAGAARAIAGWEPASAWEHYALGLWRERAGDLEGASRAFDRAVEAEPGEPWPRLRRGLCALALGHDAQALADFEAGLALAPDSASLLAHRARAESRLGLDAAVLRDFDRALALEP